MADEYFDLDARQKQEFLARFERLHEWHRYEQLPEYVSYIEDFQSLSQRSGRVALAQ